MNIIFFAGDSHSPALKKTLVTALLAFDQVEHTWLVPDPEDWNHAILKEIPYLYESFQKASTAGSFTPPNIMWAGFSAFKDFHLTGLQKPWAIILPSHWLSWLLTPLKILVEDAENDAAFLRCVFRSLNAAHLTKACESNSIRFEHGGGSGTLAALKRLIHESAFRPRILVLLDSDKKASTTSHNQLEIEKFCIDHNISLHILERREIENYLPSTVLGTYAHGQHRDPGYADRLKRLYSCWAHEMTEEQRSFFDVKKGVNKNSIAEELALLSNLLQDPAKQVVLTGGFGEDSAKLWKLHELNAASSWFTDPKALIELRELIKKVELLT